MLFFLMTMWTAGPARAVEWPSSVERHLRYRPPPAANCSNRFTRADRLALWAARFPNVGPAFRRAFVWTPVKSKDGLQLLGRPRLALSNPPFFVVVPITPQPEWPALLITINVNFPATAKRFRRAISGLSGRATYFSRFNRQVEDGVVYPARSVDWLFFDRPGSGDISVEDGLRLASELSLTMFTNRPQISVVRPR